MPNLPRFLRPVLPILAPRLPANAAEQQESLRGLVRLPHIANGFDFRYHVVGGCVFNTAADIPQETPEALRKTLRGDAKDALIYYKIGYLYVIEERRDEAKAAYAQSAALYQEQVIAAPDDGELRAYLALALHQAQRIKERDKVMEAALLHAPNDPQVWSARAHIAFADAYAALSGQAEYIPAYNAFHRLATILKRSPSEEKLRAALGQMEQAKTAYEQAIAVAPANWRGYIHRAEAAPFYQAVTAQLTGETRFKGELEKVTDHLNSEIIRFGMEADRVQDLITAARLSHENPPALGMAVFTLVLYEEQRNPEPDDALDVGMMQRLTEEEQETARDLLARLETLSHSANHVLAGESALILGAVRWALELRELALASLYRARRLLPHDPHVTQCLAGFSIEAKKYVEAEKVLNEALQHRESAQLRLMLAEAQWGQNRWEEAELNVSLALKNQPNSLDANLAQCAILLRRATVHSNVYAILDQFNHTLRVCTKIR